VSIIALQVSCWAKSPLPLGEGQGEGAMLSALHEGSMSSPSMGEGRGRGEEWRGVLPTCILPRKGEDAGGSSLAHGEKEQKRAGRSRPTPGASYLNSWTYFTSQRLVVKALMKNGCSGGRISFL
jgi:hypothetical protein